MTAPKRTSTSATRSPPKGAGARPKRGHGAKPGAVRDRAIVALLTEKTIANAAAKTGINEKTLRRWLGDDAFKADHAAARQAVFEAGMSRVLALASRAVDTLEVLLDEKKSPSVRLGSARTIAELGIHQHDAATIMRKLDEIEAGIDGDNWGGERCGDRYRESSVGSNAWQPRLRRWGVVATTSVSGSST